MLLPPLYKYLDVKGAKLTLSNKTFRHAKPSDFKDLEDMTLGSIFSEGIEIALKKLVENFPDVILANLDKRPTCASPMREKLLSIQRAYRQNPEAAELSKAHLKKDGASLFDIEQMRQSAEAFVKEINDLMQEWRVFCVTTQKDSDRMWVEYAENHKGIALRIEPNTAKDSKFQLFRPVVYSEKRPALYNDTMKFIADGLFEDQEERATASLMKIVLAKTHKYEHESEYRLAIPLGQDERPYEMMSYHPEEVTELYLGRSMDKNDKNEIVALAQAVNPEITINEL